jgi:hypothetical protein
VRPDWLLFVVVALVIVVPLRGAFADMCKEEMRTRLELLPQALLRLAVWQLPPQVRDDHGEEWRGELAHILKASDSLPLTRLIRGVRYAASMILPARSIGRELSCVERHPSDDVTRQELNGKLRNPAWAWEEVVLACDLVWRNGWRQVDPADLQIIRLSELLQRIRIHPVGARSFHFRSPNAVARQVADIVTRHPSYRGPRISGSRVSRKVLSAFLANPDEMHALAESIRGSALDGESGGRGHRR